MEQISPKFSTAKWVVAGIIFAVALMPSVYFYDQYQRVKDQLSKQIPAPADSAKELEEQVGKHMSLPKEVPSIARVSDKAALAGQDFFKNAQNGDKVLIYKKSKLAVLYRPSTDKIINVAPIAVDGDVAGSNIASPSAAPVTKPVVAAVYNATKTAGHAKVVGAKITAANPSIKLGTLGNTKGDYAEILVVQLTKEGKEAAAKVARDLGGRTAPMPKGEATPEADLLVIAGE